MPERAVALLSRHLELHAIGPEDLLFTGARGGPLNNAWMTTSIWQPALAAAGLAQRRPYQTRHTAATLWLSAGENPEWVARQLGHATTEMLFKTYSRYLPDARERDGAAFERMLAQCRFGQRVHG